MLTPVIRKLVLSSFLILAGCGGGGGSAGNPVDPIPPPPPPPPPPPAVCEFTFEWTNPTHREPNENGDELPLEVDELTAATLYQFRIPMAGPEEADAIIDAGDPYTTLYTVSDISAGSWWWTLTVASEVGESGHSNEVQRDC
jgi:hypothetical protein